MQSEEVFLHTEAYTLDKILWVLKVPLGSNFVLLLQNNTAIPFSLTHSDLFDDNVDQLS